MDDLISRHAAIETEPGKDVKPVAHAHWIPVHPMWWLDTCTDSYLLISPENVPIFQSVTCVDAEPVSLESIVHPQILDLDDAERRYLSAVIRPFRNQIISIYKEQFGFNHESIIIEYYDFDRSQSTLCLPQFEKGSMYNGMEPGRRYTLEELGL